MLVHQRVNLQTVRATQLWLPAVHLQSLLLTCGAVSIRSMNFRPLSPLHMAVTCVLRATKKQLKKMPLTMARQPFAPFDDGCDLSRGIRCLHVMSASSKISQLLRKGHVSTQLFVYLCWNNSSPTWVCLKIGNTPKPNG